MVPHITTLLQRFTGEWALRVPPDAMLTACRESGSTARRDRVLTPVTATQLCLWQMRHGHTACRHRPHLSGMRGTAAAYCQARARLPLRVFALLWERFSRAVPRAAVDDGRGQGPRTFLVAGASCAMPEMPALQAAFGPSTEPRPGCGVPIARLLGLCHAGTGVVLTRVVAPLLTHARARGQAVHPAFRETCSSPIGACVPTPIWPSARRLACPPSCACGRDRSWMSRPGGPVSGRAYGAHRPSQACHGPADSQPSASMINSWPGYNPRPVPRGSPGTRRPPCQRREGAARCATPSAAQAAEPASAPW
jgi:hypothetical protein